MPENLIVDRSSLTRLLRRVPHPSRFFAKGGIAQLSIRVSSAQLQIQAVALAVGPVIEIHFESPHDGLCAIH